MCRISAVLLALALAVPAVAAFSFMSRTAEQLVFAFGPPAAVADTFDAEARARAVLPFIDSNTVIVAHMDLTRIDADNLLDWAIEVAQLDKEEIEGPRRAVRGWLADFTKAGGKDFFVIVSLTAILVEPPIVVVPLKAGTDAAAVRAVLNRIKPLQQLRFEKADQALIGGSETVRKLLRIAKPAREDLAKAFASAGDTTTQVLLLPTPDTRRVLSELMPKLPEVAGGGSTQPITDGLRWAALGVDLPPKLSVKLTIQSPDDKTALGLQFLLRRILLALSELPEVREFLPDSGSLAQIFTLQTDGARLTLSGKDKELMDLMQKSVRRAYQAVHLRAVEENLRQLTIAMHNYADAFRVRNVSRLPSVASFDKQGKPLLSWRVHLLPFVGEQTLYKQFHLDEPWDSPHNKNLLARMPDVYRGPKRKLNEEGKTIFLLPVGKDAAFKEGPEGPRMPTDFADGTSNTILIVESDDAHTVPWTKPEDLSFDREHPERGLGGHFPNGFLVALADSSVRIVRKNISKATLQAAFTPAGGEVLGLDW
ncbi:MAG TPA: DUF1559 domain-containing protein [Gemmataceae bacterium]|jgi:hypothetical protein